MPRSRSTGRSPATRPVVPCVVCGASAYSPLCGRCRARRKSAAAKQQPPAYGVPITEHYAAHKEPLIRAYQRRAAAGRPLFPAKGA